MLKLVTVALAVLLPLAAMAQEFEVVSVKPSVASGAAMRFGVSGGPGTDDPGTMNWSARSLQQLLAEAYEIRFDQIANPQVLGHGAFDVVAKLPSGATKEQIPAMLRKVLEERFHLATHFESRDGAVYLMSVAKSGSKLKTTDENAKSPESRTMGALRVDKDLFPVVTPGEGATLNAGGSVHLTARAVTASKLADLLTEGAGRPVVDRTGLTGLYDVRLSFAPVQSAPGGMPPPPPPPGGGMGGTPSVSPGQTDGPPGILTALQQELGLRLDSGKSPVKFVVIDHVDKEPVPN
jgi:uncharacterized protein (TIGR03435 family)